LPGTVDNSSSMSFSPLEDDTGGSSSLAPPLSTGQSPVLPPPDQQGPDDGPK
jgi:hypothetical protein